VLRGIGRLDMGLATVGGLGIVLLAIVLDRITQAMGEPQRGGVRWWHTGPAGWITRQLHRPQAVNTAQAPSAPAKTTAKAPPSEQQGTHLPPASGSAA